MEISAKSILDAGKKLYGKLPDLYWDLDISGSDLRVLQYVYKECYRLYTLGIKCVNGDDGTPRVWCSQVKMAKNCHVSHVTFRKSVATLEKLGLIVKDTHKWPPSVYYLGIGNLPITNIELEKNFRQHKNILYVLYSSTFNIEELNIRNVHSITKVIEGAEPTEICRKPIVVGRKPIITEKPQTEEIMGETQETTKVSQTPEIIRAQTYQHKLELLKSVKTSEEKSVLDLAEYYEFKCRKSLHSTGFRSLSKTNPQESKNWKWYEKIIALCSINQWNPKLYIDSQFDRCKYWIRKQAYPYLSQMLSENAQKYFLKYLKDVKESSSITGTIKAKVEKVKSTRQIIIDSIITDCENIINYIQKAKNYKNNKDLTQEQLKIMYIADHWMSLSAYYLSVIPWFIVHLVTFPMEPVVAKLQEEISSIQKSPKLLSITKDIVDKIESNLGVPATLSV